MENITITNLSLCDVLHLEGPLDTDRLFSVDGSIRIWDSELEGCSQVNININYDTVEFGESDDHRYVFMNSTINPPIDKWKVDERAITLDAWFANSLFNQPLNNWKLTKLNDLAGTFFRSRFNHPLDKWYTQPITIEATLAFAESEFHQDLSMWCINPDSKCDGMFYKSKYTIDEVSKWPWVKDLNQPVEDLFALTRDAAVSYRWLRNTVESYYRKHNEITVKHLDKNGVFIRHDDYETVYKNVDALISDLASGALKYRQILELAAQFNIQLIYEQLGSDFVKSDAIIFLGGYGTDEQRVRIYPNMDALMATDIKYNWQVATIMLRELCNFEGPLDIDRLFSVDGYMSVWDGEFSGCEKLDVNINYDTVEFGESDDHRYAFMNSTINPPIDKWKVDERAITLEGWFAYSEFNQPLNNWKLTKLKDISGTFFRSKYNHPLDKWYTKPISINAELAFAESECHQDLSMWKLKPDSKCDGMFYKSKYTIEEVSQWPWVKELNQPVEDLFRITEKAMDGHRWLLDAIKD